VTIVIKATSASFFKPNQLRPFRRTFAANMLFIPLLRYEAFFADFLSKNSAEEVLRSGSPASPEKEVDWPKTDRKAGMFIPLAEFPNPTEDSAEQQKITADHPNRYGCGDCGGTDLLLDDAERLQHTPERRPNQKTQDAQNYENRQQHARRQSKNGWQRADGWTPREPQGRRTDSHCDPVVKEGFNYLPIGCSLGFAERDRKEDYNEDHEHGTDPRSQRPRHSIGGWLEHFLS